MFRALKSQKLNLYYWVKRQKIATDPSSPMITPIIRKKAAEDDKENMQCHCQSIGLDVREKSTKDLYGRDVRWRNKLVDVGPTSPLSSRYFCVDYLLEQGKWICERLTDDADVMLMLTPEVLMSEEGNFIHWRRLGILCKLV